MYHLLLEIWIVILDLYKYLALFNIFDGLFVYIDFPSSAEDRILYIILLQLYKYSQTKGTLRRFHLFPSLQSLTCPHFSTYQMLDRYCALNKPWAIETPTIRNRLDRLTPSTWASIPASSTRKSKRKLLDLLLPLPEKIVKGFVNGDFQNIPPEGEEVEFVRELFKDMLEEDVLFDF